MYTQKYCKNLIITTYKLVGILIRNTIKLLPRQMVRQDYSDRTIDLNSKKKNKQCIQCKCLELRVKLFEQEYFQMFFLICCIPIFSLENGKLSRTMSMRTTENANDISYIEQRAVNTHCSDCTIRCSGFTFIHIFAHWLFFCLESFRQQNGKHFSSN